MTVSLLVQGSLLQITRYSGPGLLTIAMEVQSIFRGPGSKETCNDVLISDHVRIWLPVYLKGFLVYLLTLPDMMTHLLQALTTKSQSQPPALSYAPPPWNQWLAARPGSQQSFATAQEGCYTHQHVLYLSSPDKSLLHLVPPMCHLSHPPEYSQQQHRLSQKLHLQCMGRPEQVLSYHSMNTL